MLLVVDSLKSSGGPELSTRRERGPLAVLHSDKELISVDRDWGCSSVALPLLIRTRSGNAPPIALAASVMVVAADCANAACVPLWLSPFVAARTVQNRIRGTHVGRSSLHVRVAWFRISPEVR